jgi:hypothetical protein
VPVPPAPLRSLAVAAQLALAWLVCARFQIEGSQLRDVLGIACVGWAVQHVVPVRLRLPFVLSLTAAALVFTAGVRDAFWVLGLGSVLVGLCLLPGPPRRRLVGVGVAVAAFAAMRTGHPEAPFSRPLWPILSSFFLFRAISFLYDRHHERERPPVGLAAVYFFLPPNVCFPVFPVVDFGALRRGWSPAAGPDVHQEGVERIVRGLLQLLAYRLVYQLAVIPIEVVDDSVSAVRHLVTNVFLIVRIMGMFHVSVGILHLFGFRLPPTTHLPFLSPGFAEFWRRANVYWRDFVVKVFFYPLYFRLKGRGRRTAQSLAILGTFAAAWFLHSYQWFWFKGDFPLRWQDAVYWTLFGLLVMVNGLWSSRGRGSRRSAARLGPAGELARAARIAGTFATFAILWSVWMTPTFADWASMWRSLAGDGAAALRPVGAALGTVALLGLLWPDPTPAARGALAGRPGWAPLGRPWRHAPAALAVLAVLAVLAPPTQGKPLPEWARAAVAAMAATTPNVYDLERQTDAYYQELAEIPRLDTPEWRKATDRPDDWENWHRAGLSEPVSDVRRWVFRPSTSRTFKRQTLTTNAWGMRDREYARDKPPGVVRIAVLGASPAAGSGVADGEPFEAVLERALAEDARAGRGPEVEVLNFAVPGFHPARWLRHLAEAVVDFEPDWVVVASAKHVWWQTPEEIAQAVRDGIPLEVDELREMGERCVARARARGGDQLEQGTLERCLEPDDRRMIGVVARGMARLARERGFRLAYLELPTFGGKKGAADDSYVAELEALGFVHLDASACWDGYEKDALRVAPWDFHPSPLAHALVAECAHGPVRERLLGATVAGAPPEAPASGPRGRGSSGP